MTRKGCDILHPIPQLVDSNLSVLSEGLPCTPSRSYPTDDPEAVEKYVFTFRTFWKVASK